MIEHGASRYTNHGCRCPACREGWRAACARRREARRERTRLNGGYAQDAARHNANTYSNWGCRCRECTDDWNATARRARRTTTTNEGAQ